MPDTDASAPDPLDQLFAAPDVAPVVRSHPLSAELTAPDVQVASLQAQSEQARSAQLMRAEDLLSRLTPHIWVTPLLLVANVAYFILMVSRGVSPLQPEIQEMVRWGANYAPLTWGGQPWRLITNIFMHFGVFHLGMNMWALWTVGRTLERLVGNVGFLLVYLTAGIAGSLSSLWWNGDVTSAGASGAVFGLLGAFAAFIWNRSDSFPMAALSRLRSSIASCIGFNLLFGAAIPVIDQAAHVGGLLSGMILGCVLSQRLDMFTAQRRIKRNSIAAALAVLGLGVFYIQHPPPPPDLVKELAIYDEIVPAVLQKFNTAAQEFDARKMPQKKFIELIENEILPEWRKVGEHLDTLRNIPRGRRELLHQVRTQLTLREEAWQLAVAALRTNDVAKLAEFKAKWKQADGIQKKLESP